MVSDHHQLIWDRSDPARAFLELRGPAVTGAVGVLLRQGSSPSPAGGFHLDAKWGRITAPSFCNRPVGVGRLTEGSTGIVRVIRTAELAGRCCEASRKLPHHRLERAP